MKRYYTIVGVAAVILASLVMLNVFFQRALRMEMAEQFNKQQLMLASGRASEIESYINNVKDDLLGIAQSLAMFHVEHEGQFAVLARGALKDVDKVRKSITLLDGRGRTLFAQWNMADVRPLEGDPIELVRGLCPDRTLIRQDAEKVMIVAPVCRSGSVHGAVVFALDIQDVARQFIAPVKSGLHGYAWMMDHQGTLLYHPTQPDMVGRNLYKADTSCFKCHQTFDLEKKIIEGKSSNSGRYVAPTGEDKILAFSTAVVGDARWIVAVSAPYSEITMPFQTSIRYHLWLIIVIVITASAVSAMIIILNRKRMEAEERAQREKELERHAKDLEHQVAVRTAELSAEKDKLNTIVDTVGSGILLLDTAGKVQWTNQTMKDMAGRDITGISYDDICAGCEVVSSFAAGEVRTEVLSRLFGSRDRYYQVTTAPVKGDDSRIHGYIRLVQDITEMRKAEEQMMNSEKLACLERLTSGIAHEIGDPLTSVFSFIEMLKEMEKDEFKKESLETVYSSMNSIACSLQTLSGFSKVPPVELRRWKVNSLIETAFSLIQYDRRAQDITIMKDLSPDLPEITTDRNQLSQVFLNVILNAVDAMPEGGTLTIRSRIKDNQVVIDFEDTGVGISQKELGRIFDPFYTTKEKGTGLGLAVSQSILKKLGGSIAVESEFKKGSRFVITLPADGTR